MRQSCNAFVTGTLVVVIGLMRFVAGPHEALATFIREIPYLRKMLAVADPSTDDLSSKLISQCQDIAMQMWDSGKSDITNKMIESGNVAEEWERKARQIFEDPKIDLLHKDQSIFGRYGNYLVDVPRPMM